MEYVFLYFISVIFFCIGAYKMRRLLRSISYKCVPIESLRIWIYRHEVSHVDDIFYHYKVEACYSYCVDGILYSGDSVSFDDVYCDFQESSKANKLISDVLHREAVYFDPSCPSTSFLFFPSSFTIINRLSVYLLVPLFLVVIAVFCQFFL